MGGQILTAQYEPDLRQWASDLAELYASDTEQEDLSFLVEDLLSLTRSPINLNTARREDLERIFFLSDIQIENILFKRYVNGPFYSIYELQTVEGLPQETIRQMEPIIFLGSPVDKKQPWKMWGDIFLRSGLQLEKALGYEAVEKEGAVFKGDRFKHYLRIEAQTNRPFSAGFIAEKDPGEPIFNNYLHGVDLTTGYLRYQPKTGWLREAVVGQYSMAAGQGLVVRSGMPARKSAMVTSIRNRGPSFRPSLSASESTGLRGGYFTMGKGSVEMTPFISLRHQSARIQSDSTGQEWITSIRKDGLHRTEAELNQRHNVTEMVAGSRITYRNRWLTLEAGHLYYHLNKPLIPASELYNQFYFRGKTNQNTWVSYTMATHGILLFGEMALDEFSHPATWNGLAWEAAPGLSLALGFRSFPKKYQAPLAGPLSESSSFAGEQGLYVGMEWQLPGRWVVASYFDRYQFNWLKYQLNGPSNGFDWLLQVQKKMSGGQNLLARYRHRQKPGNGTSQTPEMNLGTIAHDQLKLQYTYNPEENWQSATLAEWHLVNNPEGHFRGMLLAQDFRMMALKKKLTVTCRYALFDANHFDARLYAYEPEVLYQFSVPAYSGTGSRYLLLINYKLKPAWHLWVRAARWVYSDREESGSGYNLIPTNTKTEVTLQTRIKF
jgi:hypothetical protein